jgi:tetratricopeptide (TPR) repeat protein
MATVANSTAALPLSSESTMPKYDPNVVIAEANQKLANDDWEGGQFVFQSHLLEWADDAREGSLLHHHHDVHQLREAITTLYLAYAQYLITAKQYKSATEVYEDAIHTSALASCNGRIYQEYARFLLERNRRKSAQDVYKQALVVSTNGQSGAVQDEQDRDLLWNDFLEMMQMTNPDLTMKTLRQAVLEEQHSAELPPLKRRKVNDGEDSGNTSIRSSDLLESNPSNSISGDTSKTHVVTLESVEQAAAILLPAWQALLCSSSTATTGLPPDILAAWMSRDGQDVPQAPEPPLFAPSPPKLSDPVRQLKFYFSLHYNSPLEI